MPASGGLRHPVPRPRLPPLRRALPPPSASMSIDTYRGTPRCCQTATWFGNSCNTLTTAGLALTNVQLASYVVDFGNTQLIPGSSRAVQGQNTRLSAPTSSIQPAWENKVRTVYRRRRANRWF